jgi:syntaxin 16
VEQVATNVAEGVKQLEAAEKTQKRNWMLTIIMALMIIVILMIVIVTIKAMVQAS